MLIDWVWMMMLAAELNRGVVGAASPNPLLARNKHLLSLSIQCTIRGHWRHEKLD